MAERVKTSDSRAFGWEELTERQRGAIKELREILQRMRSDGARIRKRSDEPWARSDDRQGRVILLSGRRGTGKTSTLLTLITDTEGTQGVRFLQPVDLDPLPEGLPMLGWILQALTPLARWLDGGVKHPCESFDRTRDPKDLKKTHTDRLRDLQRYAVLAWDWSRSPRDGRGQLDWALDFQNQLTEWAELEERWREFVAEMLCSAKLVQALGEDGLLVISLDDPDLYRAQMRDLVLALRLLYHPRVVFLLAADLQQLTEELTLDLARQTGKGLGGQEAVQAWLDSPRWVGQPANLAQMILEKVLPAQNKVDLGRTSLWGLLAQPGVGGKSLVELLDGLALPAQEGNSKAAPTTLGALLQRMGKSFTGAFRDDDITLRTWSQLLEALSGIEQTGDMEDRLVRGLGALLRVVPERDIETEARDRGKEVPDLYVRLLNPSATLGYEPGVELVSWDGGSPGSLRTSRVYHLVRADGAGVGTPPHPFVLLAAEARDRLRQRVRVEGGPPLRHESWTWLLHTHIDLGGVELDLPWPWVPPETLGDLFWWLERVPKLVNQQGAPQEKLVGWVMRWIRLHLEFFGEVNVTETRNALLGRLGRHTERRLREWVTQGLALLASPESGLPDPASAWIIGFYNELQASSMPRWPNLTFDDLGPRHAWLEAALAGAGRPGAGQPRGDLASSILKALSADDAHPWLVEGRLKQWGEGWWLLSQVGRLPGSVTQITQLLAGRTYTGMTPSGSAPLPRNLLELFWSPNIDNFATDAWSELLRPTAERGSLRLRSLVETVASFREWEGGAAALALSRLYNWLLDQIGATDWKAWVNLDRAGTGLTVSSELRLEFRLGAPTPWEEIDQLCVRSTHGEVWSLTSLLELGNPLSQNEQRALVALLAIIQSFNADQNGAPDWRVELPELMAVRTRDGELVPLPQPPLTAWIDMEYLRLTMKGAHFVVTEKRHIDPAAARNRWLVLVWVETCCSLLQGIEGRAPGFRGDETPAHRYPVEDLNKLAQASKRLRQLTTLEMPPKPRGWAEATDRLVRLALDPEAREAWDRGRRNELPVARSPVLEILNTGKAASIRDAGIPFIGPSTAKNIVDYVKKYGTIDSLDDLIYVRGIGAAALERIKAYDEELSKEKSES